MNDQDNINGFLDSMDEFDSMPAEQAPSAQSVPYTPAAVWPGEEQTALQQVAAPPVQAETIPPTAPTHPVIRQPAQQVQPTAPTVKSQPAMQQQQILDPFEAALKNAEEQGEKRMLEALAAKPAVFSYARVKEDIEDRDATFEDLRQKYETDFPELSDSKTVSWSVSYGKTTKTVSNPGSDKVYGIKAEIENSKAFKDALKKAKTDAEKNPECTVKVFKKAQSKGEALSGFKEFCLTRAEALKTEKPIVLLPSKDGRVYEQRTNEIGRFTAPTENIRELESIVPSFEPALPKIPAHIFSKIMGFFKSISDELHYEVLVHILYDTEEKEYIIKVPKQRISHAAVDSEAEEPYPERYIHVMDFHSHNTMPAVFSETDNDDEKETRLYAVAGRFDRTFPEITVRAGCAGKFIYLPPEEVFEGNFFGNFPKEWKESIRIAEEKPHRIPLRFKRVFSEDGI